MIGAIVGDIVGSIYEFNNIRTKDFPLFGAGCFATDDSIMTLAVAKALMCCIPGDAENLGRETVRQMRGVGFPYPDCGYGGRFYEWMYGGNPKPYNSFGNGAAMRVSPVAYFAKSLEDVKALSRAVTEVTHNHPEGIKGAEATAVATYLALNGSLKGSIRDVMSEYYDLSFTLDEIRPTYSFNETCQETVPQAIVAFLESTGFEDAIRNAISIGGDSDTLACITGAIAGAYYGVPRDIEMKAARYLDDDLFEILASFYRRFY